MGGRVEDPDDIDDVEVARVDEGDDDLVSNEFSEDTVVLTDIDDDDDCDLSVELDVSQLVAKLEATDDDDIRRRREIHRRLEEIQDRRREEKDLDNTFNFNLDEDL